MFDIYSAVVLNIQYSAVGWTDQKTLALFSIFPFSLLFSHLSPSPSHSPSHVLIFFYQPLLPLILTLRITLLFFSFPYTPLCAYFPCSLCSLRQCSGFASLWCGFVSYRSVWCGSGSYHSFCSRFGPSNAPKWPSKASTFSLSCRSGSRSCCSLLMRVRIRIQLSTSIRIRIRI